MLPSNFARYTNDMNVGNPGSSPFTPMRGMPTPLRPPTGDAPPAPRGTFLANPAMTSVPAAPSQPAQPYSYTGPTMTLNPQMPSLPSRPMSGGGGTGGFGWGGGGGMVGGGDVNRGRPMR